MLIDMPLHDTSRYTPGWIECLIGTTDVIVLRVGNGPVLIYTQHNFFVFFYLMYQIYVVFLGMGKAWTRTSVSVAS
jgi:hypothetical protein